MIYVAYYDHDFFQAKKNATICTTPVFNPEQRLCYWPYIVTRDWQELLDRKLP